MLQVECAACGGRFTAKRTTAKYCSSRCRVRASRAPEAAPARTEAAPLIDMRTHGQQPAVGQQQSKLTPVSAIPRPQAAPVEGSLLESTIKELEEAERLHTAQGQAALYLARALESGTGQTGSSIASLIREHRAALAAAVEGARKNESPLERIRGRHQQRRTAGA